MTNQVTQLTIDDIADLSDKSSLFGLEDGDVLEISLMDVIIAVVVR